MVAVARLVPSRTPLAVCLTATLTLGVSPPAQAQQYSQVYWPSQRNQYYGGAVYDDPAPMEYYQARPMHRKRATPKLADAPKNTPKPQGPIVIAISIENQHLKVYDSNGLFAESPVSTGMAGHLTPMGVFSIIQKNKYHRSNIYSNAPMPYMQRITWSGVALHAGVVPGHPASHGCIRMPMNFAMRMWGWTRMGARVIIAPGDLSPVDFSNPNLIARKPAVSAAAAPTASPPRNEAVTTAKSDKSTVADATNSPPASEKIELRLSPISDKGDEIRTADASNAMQLKSDADERPIQSPSPPKDEAKKAASDVLPAATAGDAKTAETAATKDQSRATDADKTPAVANAVPPREGSAEFIGPVKPRSGHIAAYVSRKEGKLYVRQNFEPLFEVPITIAAADRPLGTHVFTARADKGDVNAFRWTVVSLPAPTRAARRSDDEHPHRKKNATVTEERAPLPASSPSEALDRLTIPPEAMERIAAALAPGGSLIVSDQGLGQETGRGTDFIVPLR
ncbi:L,D-transpeptidase [Bradyrhizobium sp. SYSU BS000235]|uniref:L,D-transpeptidase n=1 Tax=Bradyrhizobium sp. SYSU BS000235 TaxID=3411332 RepID=UPI003C76C6F9